MKLYRWAVAAAWFSLVGCVAASLFSAAAATEPLKLWHAGKPHTYLVGPELQGPASQIASNTLNGFPLRSYGWEPPPARDTASPGNYLVVGNQQNNG